MMRKCLSVCIDMLLGVGYLFSGPYPPNPAPCPVGSPDGFVLQLLLARRRAAVARVLARLFGYHLCRRSRPVAFYMIPCAIMALATFMNPATLAPFT